MDQVHDGTSNEKLKHDAIVEATFEIRFEPYNSSGGLIPGMLYANKRIREVCGISSESLPVSNVPEDIRLADPNMRYLATHKLNGDHYVMSAGPRTISISALKPYKTWEDFKPQILVLIDVFNELGLAKKIERYSLKYVNLVPSDGKLIQQFEQIKLTANLGEDNLLNCRTHIRTELDRGNYVNLINISAGVQVTVGSTGEDLAGLLLEIDTISKTVPQDFAAKAEEYIEEAHSVETGIFFSIITDTTFQRLKG